MCLSKNEPNFSVKTGLSFPSIISGRGEGCLILIGDFGNGLLLIVFLPEFIVIEMFISGDTFKGDVLILSNIEFKVDSDDDDLFVVPPPPPPNLENTDDVLDEESEESNESILDDDSEKRCEKSGSGTF